MTKHRQKHLSIALSFALAAALLVSILIPAGCAPQKETTMWFEPPTKKVLQTDGPGKRTSFTVYMAGDEYEGCQAVFKYGHHVGQIDVSVSEPVSASGAKLKVSLFREHYVTTVFAVPFFREKLHGQTVSYPDGLSPLTGGLEVYPENATPVYILFDSHGAEPGDYTATVTASANGEVIDSGEVKIHVWNFALPEARAMKVTAGLDETRLGRWTKEAEKDDRKASYVKYWEFLLDHNVCPFRLPYDILDERAEKFLNDPRLTVFEIPSNESDDVIQQYYEKLSGNNAWLEKGYFYPVDEPSDRNGYLGVKDAGDRLARIFPGYRMCVPFFSDPDMGDGLDGIDFASDYINIWCPKLYCFDDENIYSAEQTAEKEPFAARMLAEKEGGDDLWWYVCWEPGEPYCNLFVNMPGVRHRSIFWQADLYGVTGFLFWSANYWDEVYSPWEDMATVKNLSPYVYGDGSLMQPGNLIGVDGPCSCLRLEAVRDGVDDYELIAMARRLGISESIIKKTVNLVAKSITDYSDDDGDIQDARIVLGKLIEAALARN